MLFKMRVTMPVLGAPIWTNQYLGLLMDVSGCKVMR
jgi:hypothetical protein